jgi:hypothetical protein
LERFFYERERAMKCVGSFVLALAVAAPMALWAQGKPNFSGTWTPDASKSEAPARAGRAGRAGGGRAGLAGLMAVATGPVVITQTETEITVGQVTYKLDGSASSTGRGRAGAAESKAKWDGTKLVIETTRDLRGNTIRTKEVRSLDPTGKEMTVETSVSTPRGEQKAKQVFTKAS